MTATPDGEHAPRFGDARDWFFAERLGLFLHFGLYAIDGWHEQDQMRRRIPRAEYGRKADHFRPDAFDPDAILDIAQAAGMGYVCLTTKHHDGFCLWDTGLTDFNSMRAPCGRDLVRELAEACHRRGVRLGLYYSVADWHHPNYPNQGRHHELAAPEPGDRPDWDAYMTFLRGQVEELLTRYGPVSHFFWDMNVPGHREPEFHERMRVWQPGMVINDRGFDDGDFGTPERDYDAAGVAATTRFARPTEACNALGTQSWGFRRGEDYHTHAYLTAHIAGILARGGNYLLNTGPDASGRIPPRDEGLLRRVGDWYTRVREAYEDVGCVTGLCGGTLLTRRGTTLYAHLPAPLQADAVTLAPLADMPREAVALNTGERLEARVEPLPSNWQDGAAVLRVRGLPVAACPDETIVIRMTFETWPPARREIGAAFRG